MRNVVLRIQDLSFGYDHDKLIFDHFSLEVSRGEVVAIVGESGKGKSTLFDLITGELKPRGGSIEVASSASVYQDPYTSFHPSFPLRGQILDVCSVSCDLETHAQRLGLDHELLEAKPHRLSGGQLQRASILRALMMKPSLLLADEPTSALDNLIQLDVMKLLLENLDNYGLLIITHDEALATWCADRVIKL